MKTMTDPKAFYEIHRETKTFNKINTNMQMRYFVSSYGFWATRELANKLFALRDERDERNN